MCPAWAEPPAESAAASLSSAPASTDDGLAARAAEPRVGSEQGRAAVARVHVGPRRTRGPAHVVPARTAGRRPRRDGPAAGRAIGGGHYAKPPGRYRQSVLADISTAPRSDAEPNRNECGRANSFRPTAQLRGQRRSNRSRFMTLSHAATKSRTNFSLRVVGRVDLRERSQLGVRAEDQVDGGGGPLDLARAAIAALVDVLGVGRRPLRAHVEQVHEEVVGQRLGPVGEDAVLRIRRSWRSAPACRRSATVISGAVSVSM